MKYGFQLLYKLLRFLQNNLRSWLRSFWNRIKRNKLNLKDKINLIETFESATTKPLYSIFFKEGMNTFSKISNEDDYLVTVSFVLMMIGLEQYIKSKIMKKYRDHPDLLHNCITEYRGDICFDFSCSVKKKYRDKTFTHFDQPYELYREYSNKLKFNGLVSWLHELYNLPKFPKKQILLNYIDLRNLFVHYWEFPLDAQYTDEEGNKKKLRNAFEDKIESLKKGHLRNVMSTIQEFIMYFGENDDKSLINDISQLIH